MNTSRTEELERKKNEAGERKSYQPPAIVYRETLEVSAAVCTTKEGLPCGPPPQS